MNLSIEQNLRHVVKYGFHLFLFERKDTNEKIKEKIYPHTIDDFIKEHILEEYNIYMLT